MALHRDEVSFNENNYEGHDMNHYSSKSQSEERVIARLSDCLVQIDPCCNYGDWFRVLAAIFYETKGSEAGFELADRWSSCSSNYRGTKDVRRQWKYLRLDIRRPITIRTLRRMAAEGVAISPYKSRQCA